MQLLGVIKKHKWPYLFILPFFILFVFFQLIPNIWTIYMSFTEWNGVGSPEFVGFENYQMILKDYMFWDAVTNTVIYWLSAIVFIIFLSMVCALLLYYDRLKARSFFKSVTFLPNVCAAIPMGIIFGMLFDHNVGIINELLVFVGLEPIGWLTTTKYSKIPVIVLNIWRNTPWFTMIILSGLLSIPNEYYESATLDGVNPLQQFFYITLPSLNNIIFFCFITLTVDSWKLFNEPYMLKGVGTSNISLFQYMYSSGFTIFKLGYAATIGCLLTLILLVVSLVQFKIRRKQGEV